MDGFFVWALVMVGVTTIVTQSKLFRPWRLRWACWTSRSIARPDGNIRMPTLWSTFFDCPMCIGFWAGLCASAFFGWGVAPEIPHGVLFRWVADGCASSAVCWVTYVVLHYLGSGKL